MSFQGKTTYKANVAIENEIVSAIHDIRLLRIEGTRTGFYEPFFEATYALYDILPPEVRESTNQTKELKEATQDIDSQTMKQLDQLKTLDRMNAYRKLRGPIKKERTIRLFRAMVDLCYKAGLLIPTQSHFASEVGFD
tara:strand:- start:614 stop:1027 length:414 start_codon:yes stop_codon:yes gene_type:complete